MALGTDEHRRGHVLVVEDDEDQAAVVRRWLATVGIDVTVSSDGIEGAIAAVRGRFDAVVSDVCLPSVSGMLVAQQSKVHHPDRPVVVVTGESSEEIAVNALREGADDYFVKPLDRAQFVARIHELVAWGRVRKRTSFRSVLAIGAHPDDVEIGVGGTLLKHREHGDRITVLTLSAGEAGGDVGTRRNESEAAARRLGAELLVAGLPDTRIPTTRDTVDVIADAVRRLAPDVVYTHTRAENHQDHRAVAEASIVACRNVGSLLCYQSPSSSLEFRPNRYIDISEQMPSKLELIHAYASQTAKCAYLDDALIESTARYWGRFAGYRMVEPLEVVRVVE